MKLSKNFTLGEFLISQTAVRNDIDMTPSEGVKANLQVLVDTCLQPLRDEVNKPIYISSGYRPAVLNTLIGGAPGSAHQYGNAADFVVEGLTPLQACIVTANLELPFDQLIHEFGRWVHLGIANKPRRETLTAFRENSRTRYVFGLQVIEEVQHA